MLFRRKEKRTYPLDWRLPRVACSLLDDLGLATTGYRTYSERAAVEPVSAQEEHSCFSPYQEIGLNNLAYYASGDKQFVNELKLVLNVNDPSHDRDALRAFAKAAERLANYALGKYLTKEVRTALLTGKAGGWKAGPAFQIEIMREDWSNDRGYDLKFIIRPTPTTKKATAE